MESSATKIYHSEPMFVLNRNGKTRDELWDIFEKGLERDFPDDDVSVRWISIFGKYPEQPHAFVILSRNSIMAKIMENGEFLYNVKCDERSSQEFIQDKFEILEVIPTTAGEGCEPSKLCIIGVPIDMKEDQLKQDITDFYDAIAEVKTVILPKTWQKKKCIFVEFYDEISASYVMRVAKVSKFYDCNLYASFAKEKINRMRSSTDSEDLSDRSERSESPQPIPELIRKSPAHKMLKSRKNSRSKSKKASDNSYDALMRK